MSLNRKGRQAEPGRSRFPVGGPASCRRKAALISCILGAVLWGIDVAASAQSLPGAQKGSDTLVIGKISDDPKTDLEGIRPLLDYVVAQMADVGVTRGEIIIARDRSQMISYLRQGKVDWVTETICMGLVLADRTNAEIALQRWKFGEKGYRSVIFVRNDSPVDDLEDLRGRTIAFEHPGSSSGFMIPAVELYRNDLPIALMGSPREKPPPHMVGYFFSGDEINTSTWVHRGLVDAGAVADTDWRRPYQVPATFQMDFKIIHRSEPLPRAVDLLRSDLDPAIANRLVEVLTSAHESETGREALARFQQTVRFELYDASEWPYIQGIWPDLSALLKEIQ